MAVQVHGKGVINPNIFQILPKLFWCPQILVAESNYDNWLQLSSNFTCQVQTPSGKFPPESKRVIPSWINFNKSTFPFTWGKVIQSTFNTVFSFIHLSCISILVEHSDLWLYQLVAVVLVFTAVCWVDDNSLKYYQSKSHIRWQLLEILSIKISY